MTPSNEWKEIGFKGGCVVDGACFPKEHDGHFVVVTEHVPKCCLSDYSHNSRVICYCGEKFLVSDQFLIGVSGDKRQEKWDLRFLDLAKHISQWSKDPSTKCGSVIIDEDRRPVSFGFNGLPQGVEDTDERLNNRDLKYKIILHAERNSIIFANRSVKGCTLYTTPFMPCSTCASMVIQARIKRVVATPLPNHLKERWSEDLELSIQMFKEANVELVLL